MGKIGKQNILLYLKMGKGEERERRGEYRVCGPVTSIIPSSSSSVKTSLVNEDNCSVNWPVSEVILVRENQDMFPIQFLVTLYYFKIYMAN